MRIEILDELGREECRIGGEGEVDRLLLGASSRQRVIHHLTDESYVGERLAAKEHDADPAARGRLPQEQIDAARGDLEAHALTACRHREVLLVAVAAAQVATGVDVQDDRAERIVLDLERLRVDGPEPVGLLQDLEACELLDAGTHGFAAEARLERAAARLPLTLRAVDDGGAELIQREQRRGRHVKEHGAPVEAYDVAVSGIELHGRSLQ